MLRGLGQKVRRQKLNSNARSESFHLQVRALAETFAGSLVRAFTKWQ
jgi:hypothetical protein